MEAIAATRGLCTEVSFKTARFAARLTSRVNQWPVRVQWWLWRTDGAGSGSKTQTDELKEANVHCQVVLRCFRSFSSLDEHSMHDSITVWRCLEKMMVMSYDCYDSDLWLGLIRLKSTEFPRVHWSRLWLHQDTWLVGSMACHRLLGMSGLEFDQRCSRYGLCFPFRCCNQCKNHEISFQKSLPKTNKQDLKPSKSNKNITPFLAGVRYVVAVACILATRRKTASETPAKPGWRCRLKIQPHRSLRLPVWHACPSLTCLPCFECLEMFGVVQVSCFVRSGDLVLPTR